MPLRVSIDKPNVTTQSNRRELQSTTSLASRKSLRKQKPLPFNALRFIA